MIDPIIAKAISVGMALLFLSAAWHKYSGLAQFRGAVEDYRILPSFLIGPATWLLPVAETLLGIGWLTGRWQVPVAIASAALLLLYAVAIGINVARGRVHIGCGCGAPGSNARDQAISTGLVLRNIVLAAIAAVAVVPVNSRALGVGDYASLIASIVAALILYAAVNQLLANGGQIRSWRQYRG